MKNEEIGYVPDYTTCNGEAGTILSTDEEESVTDWYVEESGVA